ncbi:MAG: DUF58 domain-containing protein [Gammaproteobacteria bacterium]
MTATDPGSYAGDEFSYRLPWPVDEVFPGTHTSRRGGDGQRFRAFGPLLRYPDPRRIDLRASLRDPFRELQVRVMQARVRGQVFVAADLSASMGSGGKHALLCRIAVACAWSATRRGDGFGFAAGAEELDEHLSMRNATGLHVAADLQQRLAATRPGGASCHAWRDLAPLLPRRRALVFLLSDFFLPAALLEDVLDSLARHWVVPVVIGETRDRDLPQGFGLGLVRDRESGAARLLVLTARLRRRVQAGYDAWRDELAAICLRRGAAPFHVRDRFDAAQLTDYFVQQA